MPSSFRERFSVGLLKLRAKFPIVLTITLIYLEAFIYLNSYVLDEWEHLHVKITMCVLGFVFFLFNISFIYLCRQIGVNVCWNCVMNMISLASTAARS